MKLYYYTKDLAAIYEVSARTIRRWEKRGEIPKAERGKGHYPRWRKDAVEEDYKKIMRTN